jgi:hypothetical protein
VYFWKSLKLFWEILYIFSGKLLSVIFSKYPEQKNTKMETIKYSFNAQLINFPLFFLKQFSTKQQIVGCWLFRAMAFRAMFVSFFFLIKFVLPVD